MADEPHVGEELEIEVKIALLTFFAGIELRGGPVSGRDESAVPSAASASRDCNMGFADLRSGTDGLTYPVVNDRAAARLL